MNLLVVAATKKEIEPSIGFLENKGVDVLITGVGIYNTVFRLTEKLIKKKYDLVLNIGIAGSFSEMFKIGDVLQVSKDTFSEIGVEDREEFKTGYEIGLFEKEQSFFSTYNFDMPIGEGITVNTVHGNRTSILKVKNKFNPDIETMEGAAVFFVCNELGLKTAQIRAVSNFIEERNTNKWNIPLAVKQLNNTVVEITTKLV